MRLTKDRLTKRSHRAANAATFAKLQKVLADIKERGDVNLTRLTMLKKWFEMPHRLPSFGIFIATRALQRMDQTAKNGTEAELFREARKLLADADIFHPNISQADATTLYARLQAFQNEHRDMRWASVRLIKNKLLFLAEGGLHLFLSHRASPTEGYRLAAAYCENYDPRYGNGLNGPSIGRIEEIAGFVRTSEAHEEAASEALIGKT